jgi:uncharacterized protein YegJ (DUF2314 family)
MKRLSIALLLATIVAAASSEPVQDRTILVRSSDPEMARAISTAQSTLDEFLKMAANPPAGTSGFKIKVKVMDGSQSEHLWIQPFKVTPDGFVGIVGNEPDYVRNVKLGQRITFHRADVSDWGYVQNGKQKGSFTICVLLKRMPKEEAQRFRDDYGFEC